YAFVFASRRRHTSFSRDWSSDVCSSDLHVPVLVGVAVHDRLVAQVRHLTLLRRLLLHQVLARGARHVPAEEDLGLGIEGVDHQGVDRKSTRLNSSHVKISYAVFCLKKKTA